MVRKSHYIVLQFAILSGLKVNFEKTRVVWIGSLKYSIRSIKTKWKLNCGSTQFKQLGLKFDVNLNAMMSLNFDEKIEKNVYIIRKRENCHL